MATVAMDHRLHQGWFIDIEQVLNGVVTRVDSKEDINEVLVAIECANLEFLLVGYLEQAGFVSNEQVGGTKVQEVQVRLEHLAGVVIVITIIIRVIVGVPSTILIMVTEASVATIVVKRANVVAMASIITVLAIKESKEVFTVIVTRSSVIVTVAVVGHLFVVLY